MTRVVSCRSCGAKIIWCETDAGRRAPVDAHTDIEGPLVLWFKDGVQRASHVASLTPAQLALFGSAGTFRHRSHFETCPNANKHRKSKKGAETWPPR